MSHVGVNHIEPEVRHHAPQLLRAFFVGGDHGAQVGHVLLHVARGIAARGEQRDGFGLAQAALLHQQEIVDQHALFFHHFAARRHRSWSDAADVRVMAARTDVEQDLFPGIVENGSDDRHVRQVRAAVVGGVQHVDIPGLHPAAICADDDAHALAHRTQVHRHVRRVGDQVPLPIEHGAGKIEPFLDVDRVSRVREPQAHLLGDRHVEIVEDLEHDGVGTGADRAALRPRFHALEHDVIGPHHFGLPARFDHSGGVFLGDDRRTGNSVSDCQPFTHKDRGAMRATAGVDPRPVCRSGRAITTRIAARRFDRHHRRAECFHRDGLGDQRPAGHQKAVALAISRFERARHFGGASEVHDQRRVGAVVTQVHAAHDAQACLRHALSYQLLLRRLGQVLQRAFEDAESVRLELYLDGLFEHYRRVGEPHAVGGENAGKWMDEHARHAERVGDQAGVLPGRAAEAAQRVLGDVVAALH